MTSDPWDHLLNAARGVHCSSAALTGFCAFPGDLRRQPVQPRDHPSCALLQADGALVSRRQDAALQAARACGSLARWRETYAGTDIGDDFLTRFGCYCLIGEDGPFASDRMRAWLVYMPARLWYPWHHHPGEEMYMILAGATEFSREGAAPETLHEGQTVQHAANQPHATRTGDHPLLAYVVWRNGFGVTPVLTPMADSPMHAANGGPHAD